MSATVSPHHPQSIQTGPAEGETGKTHVVDGASGTTHPPDHLYELRASDCTLPSIDGIKCVKNVVLSDQWLASFNSFLHNHRLLLNVSSSSGLVLAVLALFGPVRIAQISSIGCLIVITPSTIAGISVLRYDMVKLLAGTYEFWYLSVMNNLAIVLMAIQFNDPRMCGLIPAVIGFEITILIDANYRAVNTTLGSSAIVAISLLAFMIVTLLGLVDDAVNPNILTFGAHSVSVVDGITNALFAIVAMLGRNALRKYLALSAQKADGIESSTTVRCITYRCCDRLFAVDAGRIDRQVSVPAKPTARSPAVHPLAPLAHDPKLQDTRVQLHRVPTPQLFQPSATVFSSFIRPSLRPWSPLPCKFLKVMYTTSIIFTFLSLVVHPSHNTTFIVATVPFISAATTVVFCGIYALHQQRQLLWRICASFDFAFASSQLMVASLCLCDLFNWGSSCLAVFSCWHWAHWVLTLDAVTPVMQVKLGYSRIQARIILLCLVAGHLWLGLELIVWNYWELNNHAVVDTMVWGHHVQQRVVPMLIGRMVTTFSWLLRLLWRLYARSPDELIMLQGIVMYEDFHRAKKQGITR